MWSIDCTQTDWEVKFGWAKLVQREVGLDFEMSELTTGISESHVEVLDGKSDPDFETNQRSPSPRKFHDQLEVGRYMLLVVIRRSHWVGGTNWSTKNCMIMWMNTMDRP